MSTAFITHRECWLHDMGSMHPECPERLSAINDRLIAAGLDMYVSFHDAPVATREQITRVHPGHYLDELLASVPEHGIRHLDPDTAMGPGTMKAALRSAGAGVLATDLVMKGEIENAFCAIRPPGHHARREMSAGFCLYNNIAIAARRLQSRHTVQRVMILDWDVHHGDGTQAAFEEDPGVLFCSLHEDPRYCYPGTGFTHERGRGPGEGFTLNLPMPVAARDEHYMKAFEDEVLPHAHAFRPDALLISDGFDAHRDDPLAGVELSDHGFAWLMTQAVALSRDLCGGRLIVILEGGYNLGVLERCAAEHVKIMLG